MNVFGAMKRNTFELGQQIYVFKKKSSHAANTTKVKIIWKGNFWGFVWGDVMFGNSSLSHLICFLERHWRRSCLCWEARGTHRWSTSSGFWRNGPKTTELQYDLFKAIMTLFCCYCLHKMRISTTSICSYLRWVNHVDFVEDKSLKFG